MATAGSANSGTTLYVVWYGDSAGQTKVELRIAPSGAIVDHSEPDLVASTIASKRTEAPVAEETGRASFEHTLQAAPPPSGKSDSAASPTPAVGGQSVEIGTYAGLSIISPRTEGTSKSSNISFPGGGIFGLPVVHVSFLGGRNLVVENQIHYSRVSDDLQTISLLGLGWRVAYLFAGTRTHSPYVAGHGTLYHGSSRTSFGGFEDEDSDTHPGLGFGFGYRFLVRKHIALRLEGAYHHWFDADVDTNVYTLRLGFATVLATRD